ncbi:hypothetical protein L484_025345 [Morus notabilis]|uniref:Uncharacterized protein n=1 Tax=Morus notabilis TaxID=981085 RepID=W9R246_9ROSA|nr:hypothetical protein L484_025345 [Morus notabilis]
MHKWQEPNGKEELTSCGLGCFASYVPERRSYVLFREAKTMVHSRRRWMCRRRSISSVRRDADGLKVLLRQRPQRH